MIEPIDLARIQFAANITFHILFPTINLALAWILVFFQQRYNKTADKKWMEAYKFWVKVFALSFALGIVSGVTMSFQFGTNWPGFMKTVGNIAGPLLGYEILTAFFLEASFLGIMLYGYGKVSNKVHSLATALVAFGTSLSAFWIMILNSWMHTPIGYKMIDGVAHPNNWLEIIFNPSMHYRLFHMMLASGLTVSFLIAGISCYRWLKGDRTDSVIISLKTGIYLAAILIPIQIFEGDALGLNSLKYQPAKVAAIEGIWKTEQGAPLLLFAIPDAKNQTNSYELKIPKMASLILTRNLNGEIKGLNTFNGNHPPVAPVFFAFRVMVGLGFLMLIVSWVASWQIYRHNKIKDFLAKILVTMTFSGWVATIAGWYVTEIGRQPFLVYGILRTNEAVSSVSQKMLASTLTIYISLYIALVTFYISTIFYMARKAINKEGLQPPAVTPPVAAPKI
ncbi:MAG: cytochrome ubiquinol oxidase subunit I [Alphaproteobacteria bacterium]|jgi:cytochrome d ubiquinol oxidase subunit I